MNFVCRLTIRNTDNNQTRCTWLFDKIDLASANNERPIRVFKASDAVEALDLIVPEVRRLIPSPPNLYGLEVIGIEVFLEVS